MLDASIDIILNEPLGTISPHLHGHFMEHLGGCIYDGCWVGEDSLIPNTGGIRNDVVEALKAIGAPNIRWPGGCFADDYHWQDGIGPRKNRPRRINMHWGNVIEDNAFGTHEFLAFCKAVGAEPYLCGNVGSGAPSELRDWVEYCNFDGDSTLAQTRAVNGSPEPFGVRCWGVGNENWGCGGNFTPEDYASEYRRFATYLRKWGGTEPFLIACGPNGNDLDWTRRVFEKLRKDYTLGRGAPMHGFSAHYYCGTAGMATEYTEAQWYELLWKAIQMEPLVVQQRGLMDAFDPERKIGLLVDEWGTWHPPTPGRNPAFLWQQNTVRDALVAALTLDIFHRHADKLVMTNIAQTINVLQALLLTDGDRMIKTPTYHVYDLYRAHQGGQSVRVLVKTPETEVTVSGKTQQLPLVSGSASIKEDTLTVTIVNTSATEPAVIQLNTFGGTVTKLTEMATLNYEAGNIHAHNTFDAPEVVGTQTEQVNRDLTGNTVVELSPVSVTRLTLK